MQSKKKPPKRFQCASCDTIVAHDAFAQALEYLCPKDRHDLCVMMGNPCKQGFHESPAF